MNILNEIIVAFQLGSWTSRRCSSWPTLWAWISRCCCLGKGKPSRNNSSRW